MIMVEYEDLLNRSKKRYRQGGIIIQGDRVVLK